MGTDADEHRYFEGMAVVHVLGGLDESDGRVFRSHLLECSHCRAKVGELRALAHDLADVERDERRMRAAKAIETKRRELADEDDEEAEPPPAPPGFRYYPRLMILIGVVLLMGLAVWNFTLRGSLSSQQEYVDNLGDAAEVSRLGTDIEPDLHMADVEASIQRRDDQLVLLVTELPDDAVHGVYQLDADGGVVDAYPIRSTQGRIYLLVSLHRDARELVVTQPKASRGLSEQPTGPRVLEARVPAQRE